MSAKEKQIGGGHYDMPIQPLEFSMKNGLNACQANVVKYVCRYDLKHPLNPQKPVEDHEKAAH